MRLGLLCLALVAACSQTPAAPPPVVVAPVATLDPAPSPTPVPTPEVRPTFGGDISWPSCPVGTPGALPKKQGKGLPLPGPEAQFVIVGLTNGPGFHPNPCLAWEVEQVRRRGLLVAAYAFTTLPNPEQVRRFGGSGPYPSTTAEGRLRNAAWRQAQVNVDSLRRTGLPTPIVWMDVEDQPYLSPWGLDLATNRLAILTMREAYREAGLQTGWYSSDGAWQRITGGLRNDDLVWVTAGPRGRAGALAKCAAPTFSGGRAVLAQWWPNEREDHDLVCPGVDGRPLFSTFAG